VLRAPLLQPVERAFHALPAFIENAPSIESRIGIVKGNAQ
jgi:hypothetical protein